MSRKEKKEGNLHWVVVHKLNGLLKSAVLYSGIDDEDEKSAGTGPKSVVVVPFELAVDVDKGI